ncbi:MAG: prenyltransferase/squalene oxidase repeat-containing protein, partial [Planctomycetota bacterium]
MRSLVGIVFLAGVALPDDAPDASQAPNLARQSPPAAKVSLDHAIKTAVDWLVKNQKPDGSWGKRTSGRTWEVTAGVPGGHYAFEAATTAIAWMGLNDAPYQPEASKQAQAKALQWLVKNVRVKRARGGELYNTWSFGFGLQALAQALKKQAPGATEVELRATAAELVKAIGIYQTPDGGLGYYDFRTRTYRPSWSTSFTTGT